MRINTAARTVRVTESGVRIRTLSTLHVIHENVIRVVVPNEQPLAASAPAFDTHVFLAEQFRDARNRCARSVEQLHYSRSSFELTKGGRLCEFIFARLHCRSSRLRAVDGVVHFQKWRGYIHTTFIIGIRKSCTFL